METKKTLKLAITGEELLTFIAKGTPPLFYDREKLFSCAAAIGKIAKIALVVNRYRIERTAFGVRVLGTTLTLEGDSIAAHLAGSDEIFLFAMTLGRGVDEAIAHAKYGDLESSYLLDSAAELLLDRAVETVAGGFLSEVREGRKLTSCFSAGYGDFPIEQQSEILDVLNARKLLGINLSDSMLMSPLKSVTAVVGVYDE